MKRKVLTMLTAFILTGVMLAGCGNAATKEKEAESQEASSSAENDAEAYQVFVSYGLGGLGDSGYNDGAQKGVKQAESELGVQSTEYEPKSYSEVEAKIMSVAKSGEYDLIIGVGYDNQSAIEKAAKEYPEQQFALFQGMIDADNVISIGENMEQEGYMCGIYVGTMMKDSEYDLSSDKVGIVLGTESDDFTKTTIGFEAGLRSVVPDCEVVCKVNGSWTDTAKAKELALAMYEDGAKIVWQLAGAAGKGVYEAASEKGLYAIGAFGNQNEWAPDNLLASVQNGMNIQLFNTIQDVKENGFAGGAKKMGFEEGIYTMDTEGTNLTTPDSVVDAYETAIEEVKNGTVVIPVTEEELNDFLK